jgi:hypothetical protein
MFPLKRAREGGENLRRWEITDFTDLTDQQWQDFPMKSGGEDF